MKLKEASFDICIRDKDIELTVRDELCNKTVVIMQIPHSSFIKALGRLSTIPAKVEINNTNFINKRMVHKELTILLPHYISPYEKDNIHKLNSIVDKHCPKGWYPSYYYNSQSSFTIKNNKHYLTVTIRKYVEE
jgi:hypothetical protein